MRHVQQLFCGVALLASVVALAQHLGFDLWGCASCSMVKSMPVSALLAWMGPFAIGGVLFGIVKQARWSNAATFALASGSLVLALWMIANRSVCVVCLVVHIGTISCALAAVEKVKLAGPVFFSLAIVFTATNGWQRFTAVSGVAIFRPRPGESIPEGSVYVLFSDPECSRCRMAESEIAKLKPPPQILHRWCILPQTAYRSLRAAVLIEMARMESPQKCSELQSQLAAATPPLTDDVLLAAAERAGVGASARRWLAIPAESATIAIQADQTSADELELESLPAIAELSAPDATGGRTLKRVPLSVIGVRQ